MWKVIILLIVWLLPAALRVHAQTPPAADAALGGKPNVLFIVIDDQNDWLHCLGQSQVQSPNIDQLASMGTLFADAHCQAPLCNPSRCSVLTGKRPSSTGIYGLTPGIRDTPETKDLVSLPETFTEAGYYTFTCGKVYHDGSIKPADQAREFNQWGWAPGQPEPPGHKPFVKLPIPDQFFMIDWAPWPGQDEDICDYKIGAVAVKTLQHLPPDKPFFVACGFRLPHVPLYVPQKWFDRYPEADVRLPSVLPTDRDQTPRFSWYLHWKLPEPRLHTLQECGQWRPMVRAYMACTTFMDDQVGKVLKALDDTGRAKNTIVVLWSDNGWHLGQQLITGKNSLWESSTHVPLIFAGPGVTPAARCAHPVELLDIFPTLLDLCHLPARPDLEGHDLMPQLRDADAPRSWPAISTASQNNHCVVSEGWRYIHYADGSEELYDRKADPNERTNLADVLKYAATKEAMKKWLPSKNLAAVPGSKSHVLRYDPATGVVNWEGKDIPANAPIPD